MKIPFSPPYIDANVINEVVDSLKSGWITTGPKVKALEEVIEKNCRTCRTRGICMLDACRKAAGHSLISAGRWRHFIG